MKAVFILLGIYILLATILSIFGLDTETAGMVSVGIMVLVPVAGILYYSLIPSGKKKARAIRIASLKNERQAKEYHEQDTNVEEEVSEDDDYFDKWYDCHMRWIEGMRDRCTRMSGSKGDDDYYYSSFLPLKLPLDDFENYAGSRIFNSVVSDYILDWDDFREFFPGMETFEEDLEDDEDY